MKGEKPIYALLDMPSTMVLPLDQATEVFRLLANAQAVTYNWADKVHRRLNNHHVTLRPFTLEEQAILALEEEKTV